MHIVLISVWAVQESSLCLIAGRPGRFTRLADLCVFLA